MPATPIATVQRYYPKGQLKWLFVASIANKAAPTRSEINAGTDLSKQVAAYDGWSVSTSFVNTPDVNSRFTSKIVGAIEAEDSSLTMYLDPSGSDARTLMPQDTIGNIIRMDAGDIAGRKMDVFPIQVGSVSKPFEEDGAVTAVFSFAITDEPASNVTIPA
ncbi:hypothetical protein [Spongiactinospora sp. TRM90649]|uniref:phage tail tube protein n=1 Tax=Spongiactinospora sp. TRM90649 TaxID=3031114 RepID=UPI0023F6C599|nr:hypothetical protein [Spongiactinospora sp. TRM90649]MDF5755823.1 hypothetical protein [Spongiactinospora sp. TRM90649]